MHLVPRRVSPWLIGLAALLGLLAALGYVFVGRPTHPVEQTPRVRNLEALPLAELTHYAGNDACASCHKKEFQSHAASEHAHAISLVDAASHGKFFKQPSDVVDPTLQTRYHTGVQGKLCVLEAIGKDQRTVAQATFGFGSGKHGITYLGKENGRELELRLSYYPTAKRWAFSPGQQLKSKSGGMLMRTGLIKPAETVESCFVCHTTVIAKENNRLMPETMLPGVGCEACHGPAKAHVEAMQRGERETHLVQLAKLDGPQLSQQVCGQCHRSPAGDDLNDPFNRGQLSRFQGLALSQSLCFTNSGGKLSCITCHDPHDQTPPSRSAYNSKCVSCHDGATSNSHECRIDPRGDCVSCHMPAQSVGMPFGLSYRTHWIKVWTGR